MSTTERLPKNVRRRGWKAIQQEQRREEAEARQEEFTNLTTAEKLQVLIDRGHGHCAQAQKYREEIHREAMRQGDEIRTKSPLMPKTHGKGKKSRKSDRKRNR